jgi:hypothetical protein
MHLLANIGYVGEDTPLRAFTMDGRRRDRVSFTTGGGEERGIGKVERFVEAAEQLFAMSVNAIK